MKKSLSIAILVIQLFGCVLTCRSQGIIKAEGTKLVDGSGKPILLRGMGLGGWMLQEGYMLKINDQGQQHKIKERIADVIGAEKTKEFYKAWLYNHTQKIDIDSMHSWGFNSVRLPMHYNLYTLPIEEEPVAGQQTWLQQGFDITDSLLAWCKANNMYLILDLHAAPGGQGNDLNISDRDPSKPSLWESEANQEKTIALWKELATRYANQPWIGGYDILNEPNIGFTDPVKDRNGINEEKNIPLKNLYTRITHAIRQVDTNHTIIIEGNGWGNNYNGLMPLWDKNMVLSFHKYWSFNDQESISKALAFRKIFNVPIWYGETGENSNVWFTQAIQMFETNDIGWCWWPLKKIGFNNPLEIKKPAGYDKLLSYWKDKKRKPANAEAYSILMQLAANAGLANTIYHKDVVDAMFRQPFSDETLPFTNSVVKNGTVINAVDYDLGKNGFAYYDTDTADYWVSGKPGKGNNGNVYRNDGVDIFADSSLAEQYYVGDMAAGEWLQYLLHIAESGTYNIEVLFKVKSGQKSLTIGVDQKTLQTIILPVAASTDKWQKALFKNLVLPGGEVKLRIGTPTGGMQIQSLKFVKIK